jgi:ferric-dicitrate binding protein FerR (iron transport regulator)
MTGGGLRACSLLPPGGSPKAAAATKRRRTLFSHVKGHFRTRGRNSAATVRGTSWTMTDTCSGTRTSVKSGSVLVRDFRLRKNRIVLAGHSYLARAPLRKKHRRG